MPLQDQTISINFSQGLDTKSDNKLGVPGKFAELKDAVFQQGPGTGKILSKRSGYDSMSRAIVNGGTMSAPKAVKAYKDELVAAADGRLYSYSGSLNAWVDKGKYVPVKTTSNPITADGSVARYSSAASGNYIATAWRGQNNVSGVGYKLYVTVQDAQENLYLIPETVIDGAISLSNSPVAVVTLAANVFGVLYQSSATPTNLNIIIITLSGTSVSVGTAITLKSNLVMGSGNIKAVSSLGGGAGILYNRTGPLPTIFTINASGTVLNTVDMANALANAQFFITTDSAGQYWTYYRAFGGTPTNSYRVFDSSLATVLGQTVITGTGSLLVQTAIEISPTVQRVFGEDFTGVIGAHSITVSSAGVITSPLLMVPNAYIYSSPINMGASQYITLFSPVLSVGASQVNPQGQFLLIDVADNAVVAKALYGKALLDSPVTTFQLTSSSYLISPTKIGIVLPFSYDTGDTALTSISLIAFDFDHPDLYQAQEINDSLVWNGSILTQYDGQPAVELSFLSYVDFAAISAAPQPTGGSMPAGTYQYVFTYEWVDARGNLHRSTPSIPKTVVTTTATSSVDIVLPTTGLTQKRAPNRLPLQIVTYRTTVNGNVFYKMTALRFNDPAVDSITFTDQDGDSALAGQAQLYTTGGVLENTPPPSATLMVLKNNRLWVADDENPNTIWPSKTVQIANGLAFSDVQTEQVDTRGGAITALGAMDDKLVMFKRTIPFYSAGDAGNDLGAGSTFTVPQPILSDVGCTASKSVVTMPQGLIRQTDKGLYLLDRSLNDSFVGADVEAYKDQPITSALIVTGKNQVRFLTSAGLSLLFDYYYVQWSTFTNHEGYGATIFQNKYIYARTDGKIFRENATSFLDDTSAFRWYAKTVWIKTALIQGFQRIRKLLFLGDYANGASASHGMQVAVGFDYRPTTQSAVPITFGSAANVASVFQYRQFTSVQKCEAFQLTITENTTGASGEFVNMADLAIEFAQKKGPYKLPANRSVG